MAAEPIDPVSRLPGLVEDFFASRLAASSRLGVGFSGGLDSTVLLDLLAGLFQAGRLAGRLSALHVDHGLSPDSGRWAAFCAETCRRLDVPLTRVRVDVARGGGEGIEAAARRARHAAFADFPADWLALAHHRDDQAETVLLNLLRGAGLAGCAGMRSERRAGRGPALVRPLLDVPRSALEVYAARRRLAWVSDGSNADRHFRRNFLRHEGLPGLEAHFPGARPALARAAEHFAEGAELLRTLADLDRSAVLTAAGRIGLPGFNALALSRRRNLLRHEWSRAGFRAPDSAWIDEALDQLDGARPDSEICLSTIDGELRVYRGELYVLEPPPACGPLVWRGEAALPWAGGRVRFQPVVGQGIAAELVAGRALELRPRQGGERLCSDPRRPRRSLRNLLQESAVPPWRRDRIPLLWDGERLLWCGGIGTDVAAACPEGRPGILPVWDETLSGD